MKAAFNFTLSGFIIGMIMVSMVSVGFAMLMTSFEEEYGLESNSSLSHYNYSRQIREDSENIRNATQIKQDTGALDVIGGFFSSGYYALKTAGTSVSMFYDLTDEAVTDVPALQPFKDNIIALILIGLFVGVFLAVLVKWGV